LRFLTLLLAILGTMA
jgi:hydroxymethylpyrimidine pyrophosphatase-like HAD family hydrolase